MPIADTRRRLLAVTVAALATLLIAATAGATATAATSANAVPTAAKAATTATATTPRTVSYDGVRIHVPAGWPVFRLADHPGTCVRFNRHAVYLGTPAAAQRCPTDPLGRTEAILVSPRSTPGATSLLPNTRAGETAARIVAHGGVITATWNRHPGLIRRALGIASLRSAGARFTLRRAPSPIARRRTHARDTTATGALKRGGASSPGGVYTGLGFDACSAPSQSQMSDWLSSPFRAAGVYIGGVNMACSQPSLTSNWVSKQSAAGWHIIPIYVGLQAPSNSCGCSPISPGAAGSEGAAAATDAVQQAEAIGIGSGNPIYDDMEAYDRTTTNTTAVLAYLKAWTKKLHADGYLSGIYSSDGSGIKDLVALYDGSYPEPDDLWVASWNGEQSTADSNIPTADWSDHQRLHQYRGGHTDHYGGAKLSIDSDYVDAATAAAGSDSTTATPAAAPSLKVTPLPNGTLDAAPSWNGESGVSSWQLEGGDSPTALTTLGRRINASHATSINVRNSFAYYDVLALGADGQTLGSSGVIATPAHVAIFGRNAFVPRRGQGGVPVACFETTPCRVIVKVRYGHQLVSKTGPERIAAGGGVAHFALSGSWHAMIAQHGRLPVTVRVNATGAGHASRALALVAYSTTGPRPKPRSVPSAQIKLVGGIEFVSPSGSGGVLAACVTTTPCQATTTIRAGRRVIARTGTERLGAGMVGYLHFTLTRPGHQLLARTTSNLLPVTVRIAGQGLTTSGGAGTSAAQITAGQVTLTAF